tara:strand:+ start:474 stop:626 length:153 start_codon:yes stop_codon:yes gene_type:complete
LAQQERRVRRVLRAQMEVMVLTGLTELLAHKAQREVTGQMEPQGQTARQS